MGREVKRVPLDFVFAMGASYHDACYDQHVASCPKDDHDDCELSFDPPKGEGWQLWQTVSDGPVTPVFATAEALIDHMCQPCTCGKPWCGDPWPSMPAGRGWRREVAEPFVKREGWAPSFVMTGGKIINGPEAVTSGVLGKRGA
jgi:hypothetical protein